MSELDDLVETELASVPRRCKVCTWRKNLSPEIGESFDRYLASDIDAVKLLKACSGLKTAAPLDCEASTLRKHRRECV